LELDKEFQLTIVKIQILSSFLFTVGGIFFGSSITFLLTSQIIMTTEDYSEILGNLVSSYQSLSIQFLLLGLGGLFSGWFFPTYFIYFIQKKKRSK